jgi:tetratricopeptide (TPR) repeat protein
MRLVVLALWGIAQSGLPTARTHRIEVASSPQGIEAEMPHAGAYARGVRADAELDFANARLHYAQATDEFRRAGQNVWADKSSRQLSASMSLERADAMLQRMGSMGFTGSAQFRLPFALAFHEKFLSTRAFLGHPVPELAARAETMYRQILDGEPENVEARLDLAALYGEMGRVVEAETEFRRVPESRRNEDMHAVDLARYYASRGMIDDAFQALDRARKRLSYTVRDLPYWNSFDRLRKDPRFPRAVGSQYAPSVPSPRPYGGWPLPPRP